MIRHSTKSLTSAKWLGTVAGIAGALLVALNVGGTIVGIGFIFFAVSAARPLSLPIRRLIIDNLAP